MLANGEIDNIEHYMCIMGPGGPAETWELCTADCICDQPGCNCIPPESISIQHGTSKYEVYNLRETEVICYG